MPQKVFLVERILRGRTKTGKAFVLSVGLLNFVQQEESNVLKH